MAGFLNARGEFLRSVDVMEDLLRDYPAESYVAIAAYSLAQEVYARGPLAAADPKLVDRSRRGLGLGKSVAEGGRPPESPTAVPRHGHPCPDARLG